VRLWYVTAVTGVDVNTVEARWDRLAEAIFPNEIRLASCQDSDDAMPLTRQVRAGHWTSRTALLSPGLFGEPGNRIELKLRPL
jgi:hypothetical protein